MLMMMSTPYPKRITKNYAKNRKNLHFKIECHKARVYITIPYMKIVPQLP